MVERAGSHKKLKGLSAIGASALFLASCSGSSLKPTPSNEFSPNPNKTPTPTIQFLPTETPIFTTTPEITPIPTPEPIQSILETPRPTEAPLSMEQQASNAVFDHWFSLLNTTQKVDHGQNVFFLKTEILNLGAWKDNIEKIKNGGTTDEQLIVDWVGGELYYENSGLKASGIKSQGRFIVINPRLSTQAFVGITNAQRSQGITWAGETTFQFDVGWAENQYWPVKDLYVNPKIVEKWILQREPEDLVQNSPINTVTFSHDVVFKDGKFTDIDINEYAGIGFAPLGGSVEKPVAMMGDPFLCQNPDAVSTCQVFNFTSY